MDKYLKDTENYRSLLQFSWKEFYEVTYEEFFETDSVNESYFKLVWLVKYLWLEYKILAEWTTEVKRRLNPKNMRQWSNKKYELIPNINQIRSSFSKTRYGNV